MSETIITTRGQLTKAVEKWVELWNRDCEVDDDAESVIVCCPSRVADCLIDLLHKVN